MNTQTISQRSKAIAIQRRIGSLLQQVKALEDPVATIFEDAEQLEPQFQPPKQAVDQILSKIGDLESLLEKTVNSIHLEQIPGTGEYANIWSVKRSEQSRYSICIQTENHIDGPFSMIKSVQGCPLKGDIYQMLRTKGINPSILQHGSEAELSISECNEPEQIRALKWEIAKILEIHGWTPIVLGESTSICDVPNTAEALPVASL